MNRLLRLVSRAALRRGLAGGSGNWLLVWGLASLVVWMRKRAARPSVVHAEVLHPGEAVQITVLPPRR